jgi:hypothetical protein
MVIAGNQPFQKISDRNGNAAAVANCDRAIEVDSSDTEAGRIRKQALARR